MIRKSGNLLNRNDGKLPVKATCLSKIRYYTCILFWTSAF